MNDIPNLLLGAALAAIGIVAAALADRVRGFHITRERANASIEIVDPERVPTPKSERARAPRAQSKDQQPANDVIAALVAAGHKKPVAMEAVWGCSATERATIEVWTRAALRRCARGWLS